MNAQFLRAAIYAKPDYTLGDPVLVTFELENVGADPLQVLPWGTPFEGQFTVDCLTVSRAGSPVRYDGRLVKRGDPSEHSYVTLAPGQKLSSTLDISAAYAIDQAGTYSVTLNAAFLDAFSIVGNAKRAPRNRGEHEPLPFQSPPAHFSVSGGGQPKLTAGQAARAVSAKKPKTAKGPKFTGGTNSEQTDTSLLIDVRNT